MCLLPCRSTAIFVQNRFGQYLHVKPRGLMKYSLFSLDAISVAAAKYVWLVQIWSRSLWVVASRNCNCCTKMSVPLSIIARSSMTESSTVKIGSGGVLAINSSKGWVGCTDAGAFVSRRSSGKSSASKSSSNVVVVNANECVNGADSWRDVETFDES